MSNSSLDKGWWPISAGLDTIMWLVPSIGFSLQNRIPMPIMVPMNGVPELPLISKKYREIYLLSELLFSLSNFHLNLILRKMRSSATERQIEVSMDFINHNLCTLNQNLC